MKEAACDLRRAQQVFWSLITAPEGVRAAVEDLTRDGALREREIDEIFADDPRLPAVDRLDIYANMYFYRLLDGLAEDFVRVHAAVGSDRFHNLATDYLLRHPSEHPSLRHLGRRLPGFIQGHPLREEFPYLADLARLDWAHVEAFDAPDAPPLTREALAHLAPERAGAARFTLIPAFDLLRLEHDVLRIWRDLEGSREGKSAQGARPDAAAGACAAGTDSRSPEAGSCAPAAGPRGPRTAPLRRTFVRVWRHAFVVYHRSAGEDEARCLEMVRSGESLARICQQLAAGRDPARATERVGRILQGWIDDGILAGYALSDQG